VNAPRSAGLGITGNLQRLERLPHGKGRLPNSREIRARRRVQIEDFRIDNMRQRVDKVGDLFKPVLQAKHRIKLDRFL